MTDQPGGKAFDTEYDTDFVAWAEAQAGALRAHKKGRNTIVDWENVAEEIESLGKSERRQLASHIATVIEHLIYLQASPAVSPSISLRRCVALCRRNVPPVVARLLPALRH